MDADEILSQMPSGKMWELAARSYYAFIVRFLGIAEYNVDTGLMEPVGPLNDRLRNVSHNGIGSLLAIFCDRDHTMIGRWPFDDEGHYGGSRTHIDFRDEFMAELVRFCQDRGMPHPVGNITTADDGEVLITIRGKTWMEGT